VLKELRLLNWEKLPLEVNEISSVLLTHGHLDHVGYLPRLVKHGFKGKIFGTLPTLEIARIILQDSARIQEEDAARANAEKFTRHSPAEPLYDLADVKQALALFEGVPLNEWIPVSTRFSARFRYNGHILGASFIELKVGSKTIVFSGDVGREKDELLFPPEKPQQADILILESTYGNRLHTENPEQQLCNLINSSAEKNGTIVIPSFAVERTQTLMYLIWKLGEQKRIPRLPVYMDSPMGANVLDVFEHFPEWHKLSMADCKEMCKDIQMVQTVKETLKVASNKQPKIVIAGSGMASGGRVLTYFQYYISDPTTTILLAGYQAQGTRGRKLLDGDTEIKLYGKQYPVKARIGSIEGLSAHGDQGELIRWLRKLEKAPEKIFLVHGEKEGAEGLRDKIQEVYGWNCEIPHLYECVDV
jgi:metallo-beta-lactamase family protein